MMIGKYSYKKRYKNKDKTSSSESKHIEWLIVYRAKCIINPENPTSIEYSLYESGNPENTTMDMIENNQKCEIDEWKGKHISSI